MIDINELTPEQLEHFNWLMSQSMEDRINLACDGDELAQALVTSGSANFAVVYAQAVQFEDVMTQTFRVRIKSTPKQALGVLSSGETAASFSSIRKDFVQMGGKWFDCKIAWESTLVHGKLVVEVDGGKFPDYLFHVEDLTQFPTVRKMNALAKYIISKQK